MKNFRKKTLALVLASVVAVAGSFAADNYKNSLMGLKFRPTQSGIEMILQTKTAYSESVAPRKIDAETYVLILPEVNSESDTPSLSTVDNSIKSVNIRTMPYSGSSSGYTKVTVKTFGDTSITASNTIYIPPKKTETQQIEKKKSEDDIARDKAIEAEEKQKREAEQRRKEAAERARQQAQARMVQPSQQKQNVDMNIKKDSEDIAGKENAAPVTSNKVQTNKNIVSGETSLHSSLAALWVVIIIALSLLAFKIAKENIANATGEQFDINLQGDEANKKNKKGSDKKSIKKAIKSIDSKYTSDAVISGISKNYEYTTPVKTVKPAEELNVVDLDALFQEHVKNQDTNETDAEINSDENDALEDFLSGFSFDETEPDIQAEVPAYDEEFYEKLLGDENIKFSSQDVECINNLLKMEIYDDTLRNIEKYAVSNPIKENKPSKQSILENIVSDYAISQNVLFSKDDIAILKKLMSVELDADFITDLRTNPEKTKEMAENIQKSESKIYKPSEILTLNVKDMLPNLSEELKAQGNKKIESKYKPDTVYFSEGYEVSTLSVDDLPDLSKEIDNKSAYISKPSAAYQISDLSYDVSTISTADDLPDLNDVMAHPERYEEPKTETFVADENEMLNNLMNATFKPFDDGSRDYEVLNKPEDFETPDISDIKAEFKDFDNFVIQDDTINEVPSEVKNMSSVNDFMMEDTYIDLDEANKKAEPETDNQETESYNELSPEVKENSEQMIRRKEEFVPQKLQRVVQKRTSSKHQSKSADLIKRIQENRVERELRKADMKSKRLSNSNKKSEDKSAESVSINVTKCIIDGVNYDIVSSVELQPRYGCHLAKSNNGYSVIGYRGEFFFVLKEYETVKNEIIKARFTEELEDGTPRYIIRVGSSKFVADIKDDTIKYVMDLC